MKNEKTAGEWVAEGNEMARIFFGMDGTKAPGGFKFYESDHTHAQVSWMQAVIAYRHIAGVDLNDYLAEIESKNNLANLKKYSGYAEWYWNSPDLMHSIKWAVEEIERLRGEITG